MGGPVLARGQPLQIYQHLQANHVLVIEFDNVDPALKMHVGADYQAVLAALASGAKGDIGSSKLSDGMGARLHVYNFITMGGLLLVNRIRPSQKHIGTTP